MNYPNLAMLVISCDKYSELWKIFFDRLKINWPEFNKKIYLLNNIKKFKAENIICLNIGRDIDWSSNLKLALNKINEENILLMMEDALIDSKICNDKFEKLYKVFCEEKMNYLNLKANPRPSKLIIDNLGLLDKNILYRTSIVPCIWKKEILMKLLQEGESPWDFEIKGSERSNKYNGFYSLSTPLFKILHCVIKGEIDIRAFKKLNKEEGIEFSTFKVMKMEKYFLLRLRETSSTIFFKVIPPKFRKKIRSFLIG